MCDFKNPDINMIDFINLEDDSGQINTCIQNLSESDKTIILKTRIIARAIIKSLDSAAKTYSQKTVLNATM